MTVDDLIAEAASLPLRDAAYAIWWQKSTFERLELRWWPLKDMSTPEARERSMREVSEQLKHEHDFAQDADLRPAETGASARRRCGSEAGHRRGGEIQRRLLQIFFIGRRLLGKRRTRRRASRAG
jgi:hypothetical protein